MKSGYSQIGVIIKLLLAIVVIVIGGLVMLFLKNNGPEAKKEPATIAVPVVKTIIAKSSNKQLYVNTQGRVDPSRRTQAASDVIGRVVSVSPKFRAGGVFTEGEVLLEMDRADYISALATAESTLADANLALAQEFSRADQALRDWEKLGRGKPSDLVLRKPQIVSAKARIAAAEATIEKAVRDLDRTKLRAPYYCRVEATHTDLGSYITPGARLADLYSADSFEVRVPVTLEEFAYLDTEEIIGADVTMTAVIGNKQRSWEGSVIRNEEVVDRRTMTVYLVIEIKPREDVEDYRLPPSGLFVSAQITGKTIKDVVEIPRSALRLNNTLMVIGADNKLDFVEVQIARKEEKVVLISEGLESGSRVIVSPIEAPIAGMNITEEKPEALP